MKIARIATTVKIIIVATIIVVIIVTAATTTIITAIVKIVNQIVRDMTKTITAFFTKIQIVVMSRSKSKMIVI